MAHRAAFILLAGFCLTMNVLLWRAEYGNRAAGGTPVPASMVWEKILTAPDNSSLTVFHHGKRIGFCHWGTSVGEALSRAAEQESSGDSPEGMVHRITSYRIQFEGNIAVGDVTERLRFDSSLKLRTNNAWEDLRLRINFRPSTWDIRASTTEGKLVIKGNDGEADFERTILLSQLQNPQQLISELGAPAIAALLAAGSSGAGSPLGLQQMIGSLTWDSRNSSLRIGHSAVRAYRLSTRLLGRYDIVIYVSRVGEILRAQFPDGVVLANDQLLAL